MRLSRSIVQRVMPLVVAGAAGAAGAALAQRRLAQRRRLSIEPGPPVPQPSPVPPPPVPPSPGPPPAPPTPAPEPVPSPPAPDPAPPSPAPEPAPAPPVPDPRPPVPAPGIGEEKPSVSEIVDDILPSADEVDLAEAVRKALVELGQVGVDRVEIDVAGAMVVLRGQVESAEAIRELERTAAAVPGVEGVRVLLHLPGRVRRLSKRGKPSRRRR